MNNYYTNVATVGNNILYRGIKDGRRVKMKIEYSPSLFLPSKTTTNFKNLQGEFLDEKKFATMRDARDFLRKFEDVDNFRIYGNNRFDYTFIAGEHKGMIDWDISNISIGVIDIEVSSENGFPDPYEAKEPITAITLSYLNGETRTFGCGEYKIKGKEIYQKCEDEYDLCMKFITFWSENCPDVISGWNSKGFDIPYIINRFRKIIGADMTKNLSPWKTINERNTLGLHGKETITYNIMGVASLDYLDLYKSYSPDGKSQESYKLGHIAHVELGENKISFEEYDNLQQLYRLNYQKFIEYNIHDVTLILRLDDKLKLFELALTLAYDTKSNYEDIFTQTRMWDALAYNNLLEQNIIVPHITRSKGDSDGYEGAYVKVPQVGMHEWVASFDLNSLYPHLMMQYNISPETLVQPEDYNSAMRKIISEGVTVEKMLNKEINLDCLKSYNVTLTPNGQFFRIDKQGFLAKLMEDMYEDRKKYKKLMLKAKQEYEDEKDQSKKFDIEKKIARYNNLQLAKKLALNSAYGTMGSQYFRFYDVRLALGITAAGQLSIKWIENKINAYLNKLLNTDSDYVIAVDTDSTYLRLGDLVKKVYGDNVSKQPKQKIIEFMDKVCEDKLQPYIDSSYEELAEYVNAYAQKMQMKREALADKGIWTAKKRYILNVYNNEGVQYAEPYVKVTGLEMIKSSTPSVVRDKMKESIKIMISGTEDEMHQFISNFKKEFNGLPAEDISFPRGMNGLSTYTDSVMLYKKGTPIHVKGALIYNHMLKQKNLTNKYQLIQEGEKVKFTYLKVPNPFKDTVISFPARLPDEFEIQDYIDYDTQFEKTFVEPIAVIIKCIGWTTEKVFTLDEFFA